MERSGHQPGGPSDRSLRQGTADPPVRIRLDGPLVGRDVELLRLGRAMDLLSEGRGSLVTVSGEAGVGKTRLVEEVGRKAEGRGLTVFRGSCVDKLSRPYLPIVEALVRHHGELPERAIEGFGELAPTARVMLTGTPLQGEQGLVARLLEGSNASREVVARLLDAESGRTVLIVEDVHWADDATADLLEYMGLRLKLLPLALVISYRNDERSVPRWLARLTSPTTRSTTERSSITDIRLTPLAEEASARLLGEVLGGPVDDRLAKELHRIAGGNPLFLTEILRDLADRRALHSRGDRWASEPLSKSLWSDLAGAWMADRLAGLPAPARRLLEIAAVLGDNASIEVLMAAGGMGTSTATALEVLEAHGYLSAGVEGSDSYRFRHPLIRSAVLERLSLSLHRRLHSVVADVLETASPNAAAERVRHLLDAGRREEALPLQLTASLAALQAGAYGEALAGYDAIIPELSGLERALALCRSGEAVRYLGDATAAHSRLAEGIRLLDQAGHTIEAAMARLMLGFVSFELGEPHHPGRHWARALEDLEIGGPSEPLAVANIFLAAYHVTDDNPAEALPLVERGLAMAEELGARGAHAWALNFLGCLRVREGRAAEGIDLLDRSFEDGADLGLGLVAIRATENGAMLRVPALRAREVEAMVDLAERWAGGVADEVALAHVRAEADVALGRFEEVANLAGSTRAAASKAGLGMYAQWMNDILASVLSDLGRTEDASEHLAGSLDGLLRQDVVTRAGAQIRWFLASGEPAPAAAAARTALQMCEGYVLEPALVARAGEAFYAAGDAVGLAELEEAVDTDLGVRESIWSDLTSARRRLVEGEPDLSRHLAESAAFRFATAGYLPDQARCLVLAAHAAASQDDLRAGRNFLAQARAILTSIGAKGLMRETAGTTLLYVPLLAPVIDRKLSALSGREREILRLLAGGRTDAQIAKNLYISVRTVGTHLDNIRDKTGCRRRPELTRLAMELDLGPEGP